MAPAPTLARLRSSAASVLPWAVEAPAAELPAAPLAPPAPEDPTPASLLYRTLRRSPVFHQHKWNVTTQRLIMQEGPRISNSQLSRMAGLMIAAFHPLQQLNRTTRTPRQQKLDIGHNAVRSCGAHQIFSNFIFWVLMGIRTPMLMVIIGHGMKLLFPVNGRCTAHHEASTRLASPMGRGSVQGPGPPRTSEGVLSEVGDPVPKLFRQGALHILVADVLPDLQGMEDGEEKGGEGGGGGGGVLGMLGGKQIRGGKEGTTEESSTHQLEILLCLGDSLVLRDVLVALKGAELLQRHPDAVEHLLRVRLRCRRLLVWVGRPSQQG